MTTKEDPFGQRTYGGRTLWLGKDNVDLARDNFWKAYQEHRGAQIANREADDKRLWDIAWAASVAAIDYVFSGRVEPR